MENKMETIGTIGVILVPCQLLVSPLILENQMEKKMENEMETGII